MNLAPSLRKMRLNTRRNETGNNLNMMQKLPSKMQQIGCA